MPRSKEPRALQGREDVRVVLCEFSLSLLVSTRF